MIRLLTSLLLVVLLAGCGGGKATAVAYDAAATAWIQENPTAAETLYEEAAKHQSPAAGARALAAKGDYLLRHEQGAEAAAAYDVALKLDPKSPAAIAGQADALLLENKLTEAQALYQRALGYAPHYAPALSGLGTVALEQGDPAGALTWLRQTIDEDATDLDPGVVFAWVRLLHVNSEGSQEFMAWLDPYLGAHPEDLRTRMIAGEYFHRLGNSDRALTLWSDVRAVRPDYPELNRKLGLLHLELGNAIEATKLFEALYASDKSADSLQLLAAAYANVPDYPKALAYFQQGATEFPEDIRFGTGIGQVQYEQGDYATARETLAKLVFHGGQNLEVLRELGLVDIALGNFDQAFAWLAEAEKINADDPWVQFELGYLAARAGDQPAFVKHMEVVLNHGYVTRESLASFDNFDALMAIEWAAIWIDSKRLVSPGEGRN